MRVQHWHFGRPHLHGADSLTLLHTRSRCLATSAGPRSKTPRFWTMSVSSETLATLNLLCYIKYGLPFAVDARYLVHHVDGNVDGKTCSYVAAGSSCSPSSANPPVGAVVMHCGMHCPCLNTHSMQKGVACLSTLIKLLVLLLRRRPDGRHHEAPGGSGPQ